MAIVMKMFVMIMIMMIRQWILKLKYWNFRSSFLIVNWPQMPLNNSMKFKNLLICAWFFWESKYSEIFTKNDLLMKNLTFRWFFISYAVLVVPWFCQQIKKINYRERKTQRKRNFLIYYPFAYHLHRLSNINKNKLFFKILRSFLKFLFAEFEKMY